MNMLSFVRRLNIERYQTMLAMPQWQDHRNQIGLLLAAELAAESKARVAENTLAKKVHAAELRNRAIDLARAA
jgi:hypothetical protein